MKKVLFLILILFSLSINAESQSDTLNRFSLSTGIGYFGDITEFLDPGFNEPEYVKVNPDVLGKIYHGKNVWIRLGYHMKTGFIVSIYYSIANTKYEMNDPAALFWDEYLTDTYSIFNLLFSKELIRKNHCFSIGTGLIFRNFNHQDINYQITPVYNADNELVDVEIGFPYPYNLNMNDLGMVFDLEYYYRLNNRISLGISCSTNLIFDIGFETLSISPLIRCSF
jgi:hypothetical protein